jgi:hypothetical protein
LSLQISMIIILSLLKENNISIEQNERIMAKPLNYYFRHSIA